MCPFLSRFNHSPIPCRAAATLLALVWITFASSCRRNDVGTGKIRDAAGKGDLAKVQALLKQNPDLVFSKDDHGNTPLHLAAVKGHKDIAELLLAKHADVNAKENHGNTPLHWAAVKGYKEMAELLLANKAKVNTKDNNGRTPLHWAAVKGYKDMAELLLANKANVNAKTYKEGATPLYWAVFSDHKDVAALLLANKADVNAKDNNSNTPLNLAAFNDHKDVAELLLANTADVNAQTEQTVVPPTPLWDEEMGNSLKVYGGWTPLHLAAFYGHMDVSELLRQHGGHE